MFENLIATYVEFMQRKKDMAWSALSDLSFFFAYGLISSLIPDMIRVHLMAAANILQQNQGLLKNLKSGLNADVFSTLVNIPGFNAAFNSMLFWLAILVMSTYVVYTVFQIPSWKFISKKKFKDFIGSFLLVNLVWILVYYLIDFINNAKNFMLVLNGLDQTRSSFLMILFYMVFLFYPAFISYSLIGVKSKSKFKTIRLAFRKKMIYSMMEIVALYAVLQSLLAVIGLIDYYAFLIIGIPLTFLWILFFKLHILRNVRQEKI